MYVRVRNEDTMPHLAWIWLWKLSKLLFFLNFTANPVRGKKTNNFICLFFFNRLFTIYYQQNFVVHVDVFFKFIVL
jgi:hypothetical protein